METPGTFASPCYNCNKELVIMVNYLEQVGSTYYFHRSVLKALRLYVRSATGKERTLSLLWATQKTFNLTG
jgi:hypothetical protein